MKQEELLEHCKNRDWESLKSALSGNYKMPWKILITALFEQYNPKPSEVERYGLNIWDNRLSSEPLSIAGSMIIGGVHLFDFANAYLFAYTDDLLDDNYLAYTIERYIEKNKVQLLPCLDSDLIPEKDRQTIRDMFPTLKITKQERETYFEKNFADTAREKIAFFKAKDKVKELLSSVLNLEAYEFKWYAKIPSNCRGITTDSHEGNISFNKEISTHYVYEFAAVLKNMGLSARAFNYPNQFGTQRGIQIFGHPQEVVKKLSEFQRYRSAPNEQSEESLAFANAINQLQHLNELKLDNEKSTLAFAGGI